MNRQVVVTLLDLIVVSCAVAALVLALVAL